VAALAQLSEDRIDSIASGLKHAHSGVRCAIIDVLTRMKHPRASELLSVALDDGEASVRLAAATALGHLGSHFAEKKLSSLARTDLDMAVRRAAQKSLEKM
jgi:HEAT repeat protein